MTRRRRVGLDGSRERRLRTVTGGAPCVALGLLLAPAAAAQVTGASFHCPASECHVAPVAGSGGGFVGEAANEKVTYVVACGTSTIATEATPDDRGGVAVLFTEENGFACFQGGHVEIHGLTDGGWYWIVDHRRGAIPAPLIPKDTTGNPAVKPWDPGSINIDLTPLENGYATLVWDAVSGSLGILPHIVPQPVRPPTLCLPKRDGEEWVQISTDCMLGDGRTEVALRHDNTFVPPGAGAVTLYRNAARELTVVLSLWGNGTGHISVADPIVPRYGHYVPGATALTASSWAMELVGGVPGTTGAMTLTGRTITIRPDASYCDATSRPAVDFPVTVRVSATVDPAAVAVAPPIKVGRDMVAAERTLTVACPSATANMGRNLLSGSPGSPTAERGRS